MKPILYVLVAVGWLSVLVSGANAATPCKSSDFDDLMPLLETTGRKVDIKLIPGPDVSLSRDGQKIEIELRSPIRGRLIIAALWSAGHASVFPGPNEDEIVVDIDQPFRKSFYASDQGEGSFIVIVWPPHSRFPLDCGPFAASMDEDSRATPTIDAAPNVAWARTAYRIAP